jgi:hypothetical protein
MKITKEWLEECTICMGEDPHESGHRAGQATRAVTGEGGDLLTFSLIGGHFSGSRSGASLLALRLRSWLG